MTVDDVAYDGYDSPIGEEADEGGLIIFEPGDYFFSIEDPVEKELFSGSDKMPPCKKVTVRLKVDGEGQGRGTVFHSLYLTKRNAWKIKQLFVGLELVDPDAPSFVPPWNQIVGTTGVVRLKNREYNGKTYNDVDKILPPAEKWAFINAKTGAAPQPQAQAAPQPSMGFPGA